MSISFKIKIIRGTDLKAADSNGKSDPYVKAFLFREKEKPVELYKTKVIKKTLNPEWNEEFNVEIPANDGHLFYDYPVKFEVYDKDLIGKDRLGDFTFNFGYQWTASFPPNVEIPIQMPLEKGFLHVSVTFQNKGHALLDEYLAKPVPEGFQRIQVKSYTTEGTLVIPNLYKDKNSETGYLLNAVGKTPEGGSTSIFLREETSKMNTEDDDYMKSKVNAILDKLKKEGSWQWCGEVKPFKIFDEKNKGLMVGYRSTSIEGHLFTTKYFFYLLGHNQLYTLTHNINLKPDTSLLNSVEKWEAFAKDSLAQIKATVLDTVIDSLKLYPVSSYRNADVKVPTKH